MMSTLREFRIIERTRETTKVLLHDSLVDGRAATNTLTVVVRNAARDEGWRM
jgi:hypothetical protein